MTATETTKAELTIAEAAVALDRTTRTVERLIAAGKLEARRVLGRVLISRAAVDKLLAGEPVAPRAAG